MERGEMIYHPAWNTYIFAFPHIVCFHCFCSEAAALLSHKTVRLIFRFRAFKLFKLNILHVCPCRKTKENGWELGRGVEVREGGGREVGV